MINHHQAYISLFYAIDELYNRCKSDSVACCASELNPFLWEGTGSADPAHYIEFKQAYENYFLADEPDKGNLLPFIRQYVDRLSQMFHAMYPEDETIMDLFTKYIDSETWDTILNRAIRDTARTV